MDSNDRMSLLVGSLGFAAEKNTGAQFYLPIAVSQLRPLFHAVDTGMLPFAEFVDISAMGHALVTAFGQRVTNVDAVTMPGHMAGDTTASRDRNWPSGCRPNVQTTLSQALRAELKPAISSRLAADGLNDWLVSALREYFWWPFARRFSNQLPLSARFGLWDLAYCLFGAATIGNDRIYRRLYWLADEAVITPPLGEQARSPGHWLVLTG